MAFEVLPAIDVAGGRLVSVSAGDVRPVEAFGGSPLRAARAFVEARAGWLHVVDVDRANGGRPDLPLLRELVSLGARVQASGGIASRADAEEVLEAGASRVVLGSAMLADRAGASDAVRGLGERAVVGIEADGDVIRGRSADAAELPLQETLAWLRTTGARRYLYTGLSRVSRLAGPDLAGVRATAQALGTPVMAAGGIRRLEDVLALRDLGTDVVQGVVVGRALYEGLDVRDLLAVTT